MILLAVLICLFLGHSQVQAIIISQVYFTDFSVEKSSFSAGENLRGSFTLWNYENKVVPDCKVNGVIFASGSGQEPVATSSAKLMNRFNPVELIITDNKGREDSTSYSVATKLPLPTWREIAP